jgi:hypothetical protein
MPYLEIQKLSSPTKESVRLEHSFTARIKLPQPPSAVFARLKEVSKSWGGPDLAGRTAEAGDEFRSSMQTRTIQSRN